MTRSTVESSLRILVVAPNYPYVGARFSGVFNEKSVNALNELCERVEVLVPRPYAPRLLSSLVSRWKVYGSMPRYEERDGIAVHRPATPVIPRIAQAFWSDQGRFLWCRQMARRMHRDTGFDAIVSFDLIGAGGLAWRLGRDLQIAAIGWATGGDVRVPASSPHGRAVIRALKNLDIVFYQSHELFDKAAGLLGIVAEKLPDKRHVVLPRGIPAPPHISKPDVRTRMRAKLGVKADEVIVLYLGRILRQKGMVELLEAVDLAVSRNSKIRCLLVGSNPPVDETAFVEEKLRKYRARERVMILPECNPADIWDNFCAADIFAFPSHHEGMPNSLLEAMAIGLPAIAFAIPAAQELEAGRGGIALVQPFDSHMFGETIVRLAASPDERMSLGQAGRAIVMARYMVTKNMAAALTSIGELIAKNRSPRSEANFTAERKRLQCQ